MSADERQQLVPDWSDHLSGKDDELVTIVFDDEGEYVRFTDYVFDAFGAESLEVTDKPIPLSIRATRRVLRKTRDRFRMRPVAPEDLRQARHRVKNQRPWDPATIRGLRVPGVPDRQSS